jgi:class 3 adenylate cyclase
VAVVFGGGVTEIAETRFARSPEGAVAYQVMGDGPVDLIVGNAITPVDLMDYEPHLQAFRTRLSSFCRHIWFDFYGLGASDWLPPAESRVFESNVNAMLAVLDDVGCDRAAVLGLHAQEGLLFAATYPRRTRALVLVNTPAGPSPTDDQPRRGDDDIDRAFVALGNPDYLAPSLAGDEAFVQWLGRALRLAWHPADIPWVVERTLRVDLEPVLSAVRVPTLVVGRSGLPAALRGQYLADRIEGAKHVELPGDDFLFFAGDSGPLLDAIEEFLTGRLPTPDPDRVLATVVFTDLVDSTAHAARLGDRQWRQILSDHDAIVRRELERFRGREVKTTGDGFLATFDGPARAVRCACAIREGVGALGLHVRVGVHTGEIEVRGDDVGGIGVHVAQRVQAAAQPGEVLVSETVPRLVVGSEIAFDDRGEHELKGVPGTWRLYSVVS